MLYEVHLSERFQSNFELFGLEEIEAALDRMKQVRFHERVTFRGKGEGIEAMAYCAGRIVGAAVWKFVKAAETVLYAVDFGHTKDTGLLLNPCEIAKVKRPSVLITDGMASASFLEDKSVQPAATTSLLASAQQQHSSSGAQQSSSSGSLASSSQTPALERFFEQVLRTLSSGGDAFIPVDTCGRSLELIHQFETFWSANQAYALHKGALPAQHELRRFVSCPVFFLSNTAYSTIEFAKAQLEWMNDTYSNQFCDSRINIWNLQHVQLVHSVAEVNRVSKPRVIMCTTQSLDSGFSFELFTQLAPLKSTNLIFTFRASGGTLSDLLQKKYIFKAPVHNADPVSVRSTEQEAMEAINKSMDGSSTNNMDVEGSGSHKGGSSSEISVTAVTVASNQQNSSQENGLGTKRRKKKVVMERSRFDVKEEVEVLTIFDQDKRVPLEGLALEEYRARKKVEREEWEAKKKAEREAEAIRLQEEQKLNEEKSIDHGSRIFDLWRGYDLTADAMQKVRARGQHPIFPYIEPRTAFDDYGELFRLPSVLQEEEARRQAKTAAESAEFEDDAPPVEELVPTTAVIQDISIPVRANICFVDLDGRCDLITFQNTVHNEVKPLTVAFIHTPQAYRDSLASFCRRMDRNAHFPENGAIIDVASHRHMRTITIEHNTYRDLQFFSLQDYQVAIVSGSIASKIVAKDGDIVKGEGEIEEKDETKSMEVDLPAKAKESGTENASSEDTKELEQQISVLELDKNATSDKEQLFIGDVTLRAFKEMLDKHPRGFKTTIKEGILTVNEVVTVQKESKIGQSTLVVDGPLCETYFLVRSLLYSRLTNV